MTKQDIINASEEIKKLTFYRNPSDKNITRLYEIQKEFGHIPAIKKLFEDDYDKKAIHAGFGAPDCYCHIMPPCDNCIRFTNEGELV